MTTATTILWSFIRLEV